jgi:hypothetical protein
MRATNDVQMKNALTEDYKGKDKQVKHSATWDKITFNEMSMKFEIVARNNDLKSVYEINGKIAGKHHLQKKVIKDKNGIPLRSTEEQMQRWVEFFYRNME